MAGAEAVPVIDPSGQLVEIGPAQLQNALQFQGFSAPSEDQIQAWERGQFYGSGAQTAIAGAEAFGRGVAGPLVPAVERAFGVDPEAMLARQEANPGTAMASEAAGFIVPLALTAGASAAPTVAGKVAAKTLPALITKAGAAVAERAGAKTATTVLGKAAAAGADFAVQGGLMGASNVASRAVMEDPNLSAESAVAEVTLGATLGGVLGFGGSAAVHGLAGLLSKGGQKAVAFAAEHGPGNPETKRLLLSFETDPVMKEAVFRLDAGGISPNVIAPAHPETAKLLLANAERVLALEAKYPSLTEGVLAKATPEEALAILRDGDKIILGQTARSAIAEELAGSVSTAFNATDDALTTALRGARSAEIERLASKASPEAVQGQFGEVFDDLTNAVSFMREAKNVPLHSQGAARKVEQIAEAMADGAGADSVTTFRRLNDAKRSLDDLVNWGRKPQNNIGTETEKLIKELRGKVRDRLEDTTVWGEAGTRQKELNKALSEFWTAQDIAAKGPKGDPRRGFMVEVGQSDGSFVWEARPTRITEWLNAMADSRGGAKSEGFTNYLDAATRLSEQLEKSGFEGAAALREQLLGIKAGFLDTEKKAGITQLVNRLQNPEAILTSKGFIPTPKQLVTQAASSAVGQIPGIGAIKGIIEGTIEGASRPSFAIGVTNALGQASAKMGAAISSGVGRIFTGAAVKGASEGAEAVINAKNYTKVSQAVRAHAADPQALASATAAQTSGWSQHAPGAAQAVNGVAARAVQHLASKLPAETQPGPFGAKPMPSRAELAAFNRAAKIAEAPQSILDDLARGTVHPDHVEALSVIYPSIHREISIQLMDRMAQLTARGERPSFKAQMGLTLFLGGNVNPALNPTSMQANQAAIAVALANEQTPPSPGSRSLNSLGVAGRMTTPMQASASRSA